MPAADDQYSGSLGVNGPIYLGLGSNQVVLEAGVGGTLTTRAPATASSGATALSSGALPNPPMSSGLWYGVNGTGGTGSTAQNGRCAMHRVQFGRACTLNGIGVETTITGAPAGAVIRFGMYTDVNGIPTTLISDFGTVAGDGVAGVLTLAISQAVTAGTWYWVAIAEQLMTVTVATMRVPLGAPPNPSPIGQATAGGAAILAEYFYDTGFGGAFPASAGTATGALSISNAPSYWLKAA